jgi:diguanylate cyclase (GGDEF)-like protein/PAS domain S-box-containing protein
MLGLRSARGRAILAGTVLVLLLAGMGALAAWRTNDMQQRHQELDHTSAAATALEGAQAGFWQAQSALSALVISGDPAFVDDYDGAFAAAEQNLADARALFVAMGQTDKVSALDDLSRRIRQFNETVRPLSSVLIEGDRQMVIVLANDSMGQMTASNSEIVADLQNMVREAQQEASAELEAADRAADVTLWLLLALSGVALATGIVTVVGFVRTVVEPLAALRARVSAIASGDFEARTRVFGPEEVASLARDFNQMTDALSAKTEALQESERRYRLLAENATDIIWTMDMNLRLTYESPSVTRIRGYTPEEAMAQTMEETLTPASLEVARKALVEELAIEKMEQRDFSRSRTLELEHTCKGGSTVWLEVTTSFLRDEDGRAVRLLGASRDITERKRAEEALRQTRDYLEKLIDYANAPIIVWDPSFTITRFNDAFERLTGRPANQVIGQRLEVLFPEHERAASMEEIARTLRGEFWELIEIPILHQSGEVRQVLWNSANITGADGRTVVATIAQGTDISERKRAEEVVLRAKEEWERTFDAVPDLIAIIDEHYHIVRANRAMAERLGMTPEECVGKVCYEVVHGLDCPPEFCPHAPSLADGRDHAAEVNEPRLGGEFMVTVTPLVEEQGRRVGSVHVARDISERKRAEEALRESESKYRTLVENLPQRVFFKDRNSVYVSCNENYARDLRINPDEIVGKTDCDFYPKELAEKYRADDKRIMESGETEDIEEEYVQDGRQAYVLTVKTPVRDENGSVVGVLGIFWDITERKRAEEERERLHAELELRAITDSLTGLCNHAHFYQRLGEEIERSRRYNGGFAVAMMDVDNFKRFNDSRGHQEGDKMLRLVADSIRSGLRRSDLAFRYGGDEFAAILLHADAARARAVTDRINRRLAKSLKQMNDEAAARLSLSAGVACFAADGKTADELVRAADAALYSAKWAARARYAAGEEYAIESLAPPPESLVTGTLSTTAGSLAAALRELGVPDILADLNLRTVAALGTLAEIKDPYIRGHQERTSDQAATLAEDMGLSPDRVRGTRLAALLHDLGKAGISKRILNKPGKLTEEEFAEIKEHPPLGSMMIISEVEALQQLVPIVRHHHERFDGKGYPDGLAGQDIPLEARILAVVDAFDAMTHERAYRKALSREVALAELERGAGTQFDPAVVEAFLALVSREGGRPAARKQPASEDRELATLRTATTR